MARKYKQGIFTPKHPDKYAGNVSNIVYRSGWELKFMKWADLNPQVLKWVSEEIVIPYYSPVDMKMHRYFVDFAILVKNNKAQIKKYLVEVKPDAQTRPPTGTKKTKRLLEETRTYAINKAKWTAADAWAVKNGMEFCVITEKHLKV
jgi:hypothetical protein